MKQKFYWVVRRHGPSEIHSTNYCSPGFKNSQWFDGGSSLNHQVRIRGSVRHLSDAVAASQSDDVRARHDTRAFLLHCSLDLVEPLEVPHACLRVRFFLCRAIGRGVQQERCITSLHCYPDSKSHCSTLIP